MSHRALRVEAQAYVVAEDDETTPNEQTTTTRLAVTTTDITPPAFTDEGTGEVNITSNERPADAAIGDNTISVTVTTSLDEPGVVYYLAASDTVTAPTPAQIKSVRRDARQHRVENVRHVHRRAVPPRTPSRAVIKSTPPPTSSSRTSSPGFRPRRTCACSSPRRISRTNVALSGPRRQPAGGQLVVSASDPCTTSTSTTADISPPAFAVVSSVQYPVVLYAADGDITDDDAKMNVALDEPGDVYYVVVPREYTYHELYTDGSRRSVPTPAEVKAGTGPGGSGEVDSGTVPVTTADTVVEIQTTAAALSSETAYDVYLVAQDKTTPTPNAQTSVAKLQFLDA